MTLLIPEAARQCGGEPTHQRSDVIYEESVCGPSNSVRPNSQLVVQKGGECQLIVLRTVTVTQYLAMWRNTDYWISGMPSMLWMLPSVKHRNILTDFHNELLHFHIFT